MAIPGAVAAAFLMEDKGGILKLLRSKTSTSPYGRLGRQWPWPWPQPGGTFLRPISSYASAVYRHPLTAVSQIVKIPMDDSEKTHSSCGDSSAAFMTLPCLL